MNKVIIYGDVSLNIIDGSSTWLVSATRVLSGIFDEVHVLLKFPVQDRTLVSSLDGLRNVFFHNGNTKDGLSPEQAADSLGNLNRTLDADVCVVRGFEASLAACGRPAVARILISYVTDLPFPVERLSHNTLVRLQRLASRSRMMFAQTEAARSYLEALAPQAAGRTRLMDPMIPTSAFQLGNEKMHGWLPTEREDLASVKLVYAGKLAKEWRSYEMLDLPAVLRSRGIECSLTVTGNKF